MQTNKFLVACLLVYAVLTGLLIATVPIDAAPDEGAHLEYARYLAEKKAFPVFEPRGASAPGYEFHQPPLYYALAAIGYSVLPPAPVVTEGWHTGSSSASSPSPSLSPSPLKSPAAYAARIISLLCGALTLVFLWRSLRLLFPEDSILPPLATGFAAIWPMHIAVGASAGNDALAGALCAGMFWAIARFSRRVESSDYSWRDAALIGVFFGLAMLAKSTALVVGIAAIGATFHLAQRGGKVPFAAAGIALGAALLICGPWLVRNNMLYGDPLAARIFDEAFAGSPSRREFMQTATRSYGLDYLRAWMLIAFSTCWGFFGGPNTAIAMLNPFSTRGPRFEAFTALPVMLFPFLATIVVVWGIVRWKFHEWKNPVLPVLPKIALIWWGLGLFGVCLALLRFNLTYFQAQARYLHPALLPMALVFALGWREILGEGRALRAFAIGFGIVLVLLTLWNALGWRTLV